MAYDCDPVRDAGIRGLLAMTGVLPTDDTDPVYPEVVRRVWVAKERLKFFSRISVYNNTYFLHLFNRISGIRPDIRLNS